MNRKGNGRAKMRVRGQVRRGGSRKRSSTVLRAVGYILLRRRMVMRMTSRSAKGMLLIDGWS